MVVAAWFVFLDAIVDLEEDAIVDEVLVVFTDVGATDKAGIEEGLSVSPVFPPSPEVCLEASSVWLIKGLLLRACEPIDEDD